MIAPNFTMNDQNGKPLSLQQYRGKVVVLDFWATWCGPCRRVLPHFKGLWDKYKSKDVVFIGISLDKVRKILAHRKSSNAPVTIILDCCHAGGYTLGDSRMSSLDRGRVEQSIPTPHTGHSVLAACGATEKAIAILGGENSIFTTALLKGLTGLAASDNGSVTVTGLYNYVVSDLDNSLIPKPVFRADLEGVPELGSGFPPLIRTRLTSEGVLGLVEQAKVHLDSYLRRPSVGFEAWKAGGFQDACKALEPILRWFRSRIAEHEDLQHDKDFMDAYRSAIGRLSQLGNLDIGTRMPAGLVSDSIGSGAFGRVWKVTSDSSSPALAYKTFHPNELTVSDKIKRFRRGYEAMKQLNHPKIVRVHEYTEVPLGFYMEYIDGPNLRELNPATLDGTVSRLGILAGVAETLQHAHLRQVVHRDVKPENILLKYDSGNESWVPYLTDFDLAWFSTATQFTQDGIGTYQYAAPEQLSSPRSSAAHAKTVDFYSFGQLVYFSFTGSDPTPNNREGCESNLARALSACESEGIARGILELYRDCVQIDPYARPKSFRSVTERLADMIVDLRTTEMQTFDVEKLFREIVYSVVGLEPKNRDQRSASFQSPSQQYLITLALGESPDNPKPGTINVEVRFVPVGEVPLEGVTGSAMRKMLNQRVDKAIAADEKAYRKSGTQGKYEVYVQFVGVDLNKAGVDRMWRAITGVIDALEGA